MFHLKDKPKPDDTLEIRARKAVNGCDLEECQRLFEIAKAMPVEEAQPVFLAFFSRPYRQFAAKKWLRRDLIGFRHDVLQYLEQIGPPHCVQPLIEAMGLAPLGIAQEACEILILIGEPALPNLIACIREPNGILYRKPLKAIEAMARIDSPEVALALASMLSRQRSIRTANVPFLVNCLLVGLFPAIVLHFLRHTVSPSHIARMILIGTFSNCCAMRYMADRNCLKGEEELDKAACFALVEIGDTAAIPELISAATTARAPSTRKLAAGALVKLVPLLQSPQAPELTAAQEKMLTGLIGGSLQIRFGVKDINVALASVKALEFLGTGQSASFIEKLTRGPDSPIDDLVPAAIRTEALRLLPILQERKRNEEQVAVLLRPAELVRQELLLRPASKVNMDDETERAQLLRPEER